MLLAGDRGRIVAGGGSVKGSRVPLRGTPRDRRVCREGSCRHALARRHVTVRFGIPRRIALIEPRWQGKCLLGFVRGRRGRPPVLARRTHAGWHGGLSW